MHRADAVPGRGEFKLKPRLQPPLDRTGTGQHRLRQRAHGKRPAAARLEPELRDRTARARRQCREALLQSPAAALADDDDEPADAEEGRDAQRADQWLAKAAHRSGRNAEGIEQLPFEAEVLCPDCHIRPHPARFEDALDRAVAALAAILEGEQIAQADRMPPTPPTSAIFCTRRMP